MSTNKQHTLSTVQHNRWARAAKACNQVGVQPMWPVEKQEEDTKKLSWLTATRLLHWLKARTVSVEARESIHRRKHTTHRGPLAFFPRTLPRGKGCPLPQQKHCRSCRTSLNLQHHSPGGAPTIVTCSYIVGLHRWTLGWGNLVQQHTPGRAAGSGPMGM